MIHLIHIIFAIVFFYLINWIGKNSVSLGYTQLSVFVEDDEAPAFNFILKTFSPVVYIIILSTVLYSIKADFIVNNIWLVVLYYFLYRMIYNILMGRALLINWTLYFFQAVISISFSYYIYEKLISNKINLLPDFQTIGNEIWIIIFMYLYTVLNNIKISDKAKDDRRKRYLRNVYNKLKTRYDDIVKKYNLTDELEKLLYSIMIYENFSRPKVFRFIENMLPNELAKTKGIMQIRTVKNISDSDSIEMAIKKIRDDFRKAYSEIQDEYEREGRNTYLDKEWMIRYSLKNTIKEYNKDEDYISEVLELYEEIDLLFS